MKFSGKWVLPMLALSCFVAEAAKAGVVQCRAGGWHTSYLIATSAEYNPKQIMLFEKGFGPADEPLPYRQIVGQTRFVRGFMGGFTLSVDAEQEKIDWSSETQCYRFGHSNVSIRVAGPQQHDASEVLVTPVVLVNPEARDCNVPTFDVQRLEITCTAP
jgi:hypothetical protein